MVSPSTAVITGRSQSSYTIAPGTVTTQVPAGTSTNSVPFESVVPLATTWPLVPTSTARETDVGVLQKGTPGRTLPPQIICRVLMCSRVTAGTGACGAQLGSSTNAAAAVTTTPMKRRYVMVRKGRPDRALLAHCFATPDSANLRLRIQLTPSRGFRLHTHPSLLGEIHFYERVHYATAQTGSCSHDRCLLDTRFGLQRG